MRFFPFLLLLLIIVSCDTSSSLKKVDPYVFVHDNSSKIWLVEKLLKDGKDFTPMQFNAHSMIIFHQSRNAYVHRIIDFSKQNGAKCYYWMDREKNEFGFQFTKNTWLFSIVNVSRTKLVLKPKSKSYPYTIVLVPFPEY